MNIEATSKARQPNVLARSEVLALSDGGAFCFSVAFSAKSTYFDKAPALAAFEFLDAQGASLNERHPGFGLSARFGSYLYLGDKGQEGIVRIERTLRAPPLARQVVVYLYRWGAAKVQVSENLELTPSTAEITPPLPLPSAASAPFTKPTGATTELNKSLWDGRIALQPGCRVTLSARIEVVGCDPKRAPLVAALIFQNAAGEVLSGPFSGISHSERFGAYVYLGEKGRSGIYGTKVNIVAPPEAAHLSVELHSWLSSSVQLLEAANLHQSANSNPSQIICSVEAAVGEGEPVGVSFSADCQAPLASKSLLVRPSFFDAAGEPIEPFDKLAISPQIGPYRYLIPEDSEAKEVRVDPSRAAARTGFTTPAGTARMRADIFLWREAQTLSEPRAELSELARTGLISVKGRLPLRRSHRVLCLTGEIRATGPIQPEVGRIELRFLSEAGDLILLPIKGLSQTSELANFAPLRCSRLDGLCDLKLTVVVPDGAQQLLWRIWPTSGAVLKLEGELAAEFPDTDLKHHIAALPDAVTPVVVGDTIEPDLLNAWPKGPLLTQIEDGQIMLLGAAVSQAAPERWVRLKAELTIERQGSERTRVGICPTWFNAEGVPLMVENPAGCTVMPEVGPTRFATPIGQVAGDLLVRESFLHPENAAYVAFLLVVLGPDGSVKARRLQVSAIEPDAVHEGIETASMDREQLVQMQELARATHDLRARWAVSHALALQEPKNTKFARQADILDQHLTELDPSWLPPLAWDARPYSDPDPKAVLHLFKVIYPGENTGGAVRSTAIVEAQASQGLRPVACLPLNSLSAKPGAAKDGLEVVDRNGVRICYPILTGINSTQIGLADRLTLETALAARAVKTERVGLIHAASGFRGYDNALKGLALARAYNLPLVYEVRSFHEHTWRPLLANQMGHGLTRRREVQEDRCMAGADAVVTISQAMVGNLLARGVPKERLFFVPNAIDSHFETLPDPAEIQEKQLRVGLNESRTLGYISNFSQREGHAVLLEAFARLVDGQGYDDLKLVLVGDGPEWTNIRDASARLGLADKVIMPGNVDHEQIKLWYHMIDLFVVPRIPDFAADYVTPLKPFEAMSQGIPVIMSDRPVSREIAGEDERHARIFATGKVEALASLVAEELGAPERLQVRARVAQEWVLAERIWSSVVTRYQDVYAAARSIHAERCEA